MKSFVVLSCVAFATLAASSIPAPARADLRPPPLVRPQEKTPVEAKLWLAASVNAMKSNDMALAEKLCDPRGYRDNLVGGSGNPLESLFAQGGRKAWHLVADFDQSRRLRGNQGVILRATVRDNASGESLDEVYVLVIKSTDSEGVTRWLALGSGEDFAQVDALATRFMSGRPLAPPPPVERETPAPE